MVEDLNNIVSGYKPFVLKNKRLFGPGIYPRIINGKLTKKIVTKETLKKAFRMTDWTNSKNKALFQMHKEDTANWMGNVENQKIDDNGTVFGDLHIFDKAMAVKLGAGKARFGISPQIQEPRESQSSPYMDGIGFANFSIELDPADQLTFLNFADITEEEKAALEEDLIKGRKGDDKTNNNVISDGPSMEDFKAYKDSVDEKFSHIIEKLDANLKAEKKIKEEDDSELVKSNFAAARIKEAKNNLAAMTPAALPRATSNQQSLTEKMLHRFEKLKIL